MFARAEPAGSASELLEAIASAVMPPLSVRTRFAGTELDVSLLEATLSGVLGDWQDEDEAQRPRMVLVDGADEEQIRVLFGRYRDSLWDLPLTWVVAGRRSAPPPPADAFFDRILKLAPWPPERIQN